MDIFTTQLTRVVPVPIKPEKLRVKAPAKEGEVRQVNKERNPITELSYIAEREQKEIYEKDGDRQSSGQKQDKLSDEQTSKDSASQNKEAKKDEDDEDVHHLDIYV
ncbi:hypothetical protein [Thalassotalea fusca]